MIPELITKNSLADLQKLFQVQKENMLQLRLSTAEERLLRLKKLRSYLLGHRDEAINAAFLDFRKPESETMLGEMFALIGELNYTIKHLKNWMRPQLVPTPLSVMGTSNHIQYEPKGQALIISPWNYPISLALKPLVSAIAAGCTAIIKPSEHTPHSSAFVKKVVENCFPANEVVVVEGDAEVSKSLLSLPFNHIFFTGSPAIGKIVMKAAAEHLASVTLELGGKSPCIIDESADLTSAAQKVAWGKFFNNGQTCIAPDYLMVHRSVKESFIKEFRKVVKQMYNPNGSGVEASNCFCRIVNDSHYKRVQAMLDDAISSGAKIEFGGLTNATERFIEPTLLTRVSDSMKIMKEEIFGPLLPLIEFENLDTVIAYINADEKPLAQYIFSTNQATIERLLRSTSAGDALINEVFLQFGNHELPFGGVNNSGIGKSNGFFGFQEFSNAKGIMRRRFGTLKFLFPPYTERIKKLINWAVKYV